METLSTTLHKIDTENNECVKYPIDPQKEDLQIYIKKLITGVAGGSQYKEFYFERETTEVYACIQLAFQKQSLSDIGDTIALRLLAQEVSVEEEYFDRLSKDGSLIRKGSFLQVLLNDDGILKYLCVKLDHQEFLDGEDFTRRLGLAYSRQVYKVCIVSVDNDFKSTNVSVCDNNKRIATYWWKSFLELTEKRTDEINTERASSKVISKLGKLKNIAPMDYTCLRNTVISEFRKKDAVMNYSEFIERVFEHYEPQEEEAKKKMPELISALKKLPEQFKFDTQFNLVPKMVKARIRKFQLSGEIDLITKDGIEQFDEKIWAAENPDGKKLVMIHSPEGFKQFKQKPYFTTTLGK